MTSVKSHPIRAKEVQFTSELSLRGLRDLFPLVYITEALKYRDAKGSTAIYSSCQPKPDTYSNILTHTQVCGNLDTNFSFAESVWASTWS